MRHLGAACSATITDANDYPFPHQQHNDYVNSKLPKWLAQTHDPTYPVILYSHPHDTPRITYMTDCTEWPHTPGNKFVETNHQAK